MIVFDTSKIATNIINSIGHGLRRWVHKLRRWNKHYILLGRLTWSNIIGVPVSCWSESVFKKIAALHGRVIGSNYCNLEGNQNLIVGKVQVHTINKGLIKESLYVKVYGRKFKVEVNEEVGDIMDFGMEEIITNRKIENEMEEKGDENDMAISDNESCDESSEEGTESEEEGNEVKDDVGLELRADDDGGRKMEKDEESRFSGMSRVCETPEVEITKKEKKSAKSAVDVDKTPREETCGEKENKEKTITCEKKLDTQDRDISSDKSRNIASQMKGVGNNGEMGQVNDVGPILSKTCIPDQNQIEMNMNGPKERNGHVRDSGAMDESSNVKIRRTRRGKDDIKNNKKHLDEISIAETSVTGGKRGVHPTSSNSSGDDRLNKKRKENGNKEGDAVSNMIKNTSGIKDVDFEEANKNNVFNEGGGNGARSCNKKSKLLKKEKNVVRIQGAGDLGAIETGMADVYKAFHDEGDGKKETFVFRSTGRADSGNKGCSINMDQVKEIGELIGISWAKAENIKERDGEILGREDDKVDHQGLGESEKKGWIKSIIREERPDIIGLQETKCGMIDDSLIEELWGGRGFGFTQLAANGNSGGILLIWDTNSFTYKDGMGDERFVAVKGEWKGRDIDVGLACIYGPHVGRQKASLWDRIRRLMDNSKGAWCIFGDLNVVRNGDERRNSHVNTKETTEFNDFINDANLIEILMGGRKFTRVSDDGLKFSKLDRFLLNEEFCNLWGNLSVVALDRKLSDHCPIVLKDIDLDFGPKPFWAFDIWLEEKDIGLMWSKERFGVVNENIEVFRKEAMTWELEAENRALNEIEREAWMKARKSWVDKENELRSMLRQKARIKWDVEGDENSRFFHAYFKRRNNKTNIRGLMVNGLWCEDPKLIKAEMARHYKALFSEGTSIRLIFCCDRVEKISVDDAFVVEKDFTEGEIWDAIRGCEGDKAPSPDGFNFKYIRKFWDILKADPD
ncbi:putative ribonuclease H protein [Tanacetum coccineum]